MLSSKTVVLDVEGFGQKREKFFVRDFGICTEDSLGCMSFLPSTIYSGLTTQTKAIFQLVK